MATTKKTPKAKITKVRKVTTRTKAIKAKNSTQTATKVATPAAKETATTTSANAIVSSCKRPGRPAGQPKTGGRVAGTPNKVSAKVRSVLANVTEEYYNSECFKKDLADLEPKDRLMVIERFTNYVAPKLQSTTLEVDTETKKTIEDRLVELSADEE